MAAASGGEPSAVHVADQYRLLTRWPTSSMKRPGLPSALVVKPVRESLYFERVTEERLTEVRSPRPVPRETEWKLRHKCCSPTQ